MHNAGETEIITLGCRLNTFESEVMRNHAGDAALTDTVIINSCAVTQEAVRQTRKAIRQARKRQPQARIIVTGCAAQIDPADFAAMAEVDAVWGNSEKLDPARYAPPGATPDFGLAGDERVQVNDIMSVHETASHMIAGFAERARAFVQIQNGCDHRCTFCIIPYGRGNSRSVPAGDVVAQINRLAANGYREVVLTGVDITAWGGDLPGRPSLGRLCRQILDGAPTLERLRLSSIDSVEVDEALLQTIATEPRLMPHLHLSLQSGDDMILKRMKRRHSRADTLRFCDRIREIRPEIVFGADIIAGFPTETEAMFENTLALVADAGLTYLHVFPYSARQGTPAARMPQLPGDIIRERAARLRAAGDTRRTAHFQSRVGATDQVLVEKNTASGAIGHARDYAPVRLKQGAEPGAIVDARLTAANENGLTGEVLNG